MNRYHLHSQSPQVHHRGGHCDKHHLLVLLHTWEHTGPIAATVECSGQYLHARSMSLPRILQLGEVCAALPVWAKWNGVLHVWSTCGRENHHIYQWLQRWPWPTTTSGPWTGTTCDSKHLRGGHCNRTLPVEDLTPLGSHSPCWCYCQMLWTPCTST